MQQSLRQGMAPTEPQLGCLLCISRGLDGEWERASGEPPGQKSKGEHRELSNSRVQGREKREVEIVQGRSRETPWEGPWLFCRVGEKSGVQSTV